MRSRRDFLGLLGLTVGASLTGCGGSGGGDGASFNPGGGFAPLGYRFVPVASAGGTLPKNSAILTTPTEDGPPFLGAVSINDRRHVCFHANDQLQRKGIFEVDYDVNGNKSPLKHMIQEGDVLADGTVVSDVSGGYLNNNDEFACVVTDRNGFCSMQISRNLGPFQTMFKDYEAVSPDCVLDGDMLPEVGLADNGDLLFVCCGKDREGNATGEGLYYTPRDVAANTVKLLGENQLLPGSSCVIRTFGFCEVGNDGRYLVQGCAATTESGSATEGDTTSGKSYLCRGRIGENPEVLVADPSLGIAGAIPGSVFMGARQAGSDCAFVCQTTPDNTQLYLNRTKLLEASMAGTGALSPRGNKIISMFPAVFGPNGQMLVQVFTNVGAELLSYNGGGRFSSVLGSGDIIDGKTVAMILFGCLPHAVNAHGEIALVAEFTNGQSAVLVGMPV